MSIFARIHFQNRTKKEVLLYHSRQVLFWVKLKILRTISSWSFSFSDCHGMLLSDNLFSFASQFHKYTVKKSPGNLETWSPK
jgi:hypothetical protein